MRKGKLQSFGKLFVICFIAAIGALLLNSCNRLGLSSPDNYDTADTLQSIVAQQIMDVENPVFIDVNDVLDYQQQQIDNTTTENLFLSLPEYVLKNVAEVLFRKGVVVTKYTIVNEYRRCSDIYNNLPKNAANDSINEVDKSATDLGDRNADKIISSSVKRRTDTINGKPVRIITKTEESYE